MPDTETTNAEQARSKFWSLAQDGASNVMSEASRVWKGPDRRNYAREKYVLSNAINPLYWGIGSALICFVTFRLTGSRFFQRYRVKLRAIVNMEPDPSKPLSNAELKSEAVNDAFSAILDLSLSMLIGLSATGILIDQRAVQRDFELSPLVPGKSLVAKHMCPDLSRFHRSIENEPWNKEDPALASLAVFARNCERRARVEADVRQRNNLDANQEVAIPEDSFPAAFPPPSRLRQT